MYDVLIDEFSGPMDLLLELIKKNKMDIMNIKLEIIIDEYLDYIHMEQDLNLNIASSYLVMAAELLEIKSRMLLPCNKEDDETLEEDPKERLIKRLIEYQKYKDQVDNFKELELERSEYYTKLPENISEFSDNNSIMIDNITLDDLVLAMRKFLERKELDKPIKTKVTKKEYSVEDSIKSIKNKFKISKKINFYDLFEVKTKEYVVVTFLAILELCKDGEIRITQENSFDNIVCEAK